MLELTLTKTRPGLEPDKFPTSPAEDTNAIGPSQQWLRKIELLVYESNSSKGTALNLTPDPRTQLQVVWQVRKSTTQSPNLLNAKIYNLAPSTIAKVVTLKRVQLSAGYIHGRYGNIFNGTVVQYRRGKENSTDTYLEIIAGDGDDSITKDIIQGKWAAGTVMRTVIQDQLKQMKGTDAQPIAVGDVVMGSYGDQKLLRQMTSCRMGQAAIRDHCNGGNADWFIDDGKHQIVDRTKYRPGDAAILSPSTGLVGIPEVTPQGIQARCLLNPDLKLGGLVKIETSILSGAAFTPGMDTKLDSSGNPIPNLDPATAGVTANPALFGQQLISSFTSPTGTYKILLLDHNGETRGNPWYSSIVCVALDISGNIIKTANLAQNRSLALAGAP